MERRVGGNHSHEDGNEPKTPKDLPGQGEDENKQRKGLQDQSVKDFFSLFYRQNLKEQCMNQEL